MRQNPAAERKALLWGLFFYDPASGKSMFSKLALASIAQSLFHLLSLLLPMVILAEQIFHLDKYNNHIPLFFANNINAVYCLWNTEVKKTQNRAMEVINKPCLIKGKSRANIEHNLHQGRIKLYRIILLNRLLV
jgi:hypothetical protein